ncbi:helix-turn-helix transcriptional regulator [Crenobacter sp. SG2303]|uniref:Helix-turn-helix transcriptional regulator n=1 Tax=Crenobacter oryzisoli TaxID=3056844 RepID=A0ABT7XP96_9NEIS|nr:helix-turn-helix transcriptional regulator [Crenobacter sp. SG2303]MDN0075615.1 helix-turn-helix transcriptional regulator [Crenobacter sp. SG2303]
MSISDRLREERMRLNLNQTETAKACNVGFSTYQGYERGERFPNAEALELLYHAGFDVLYVVAGVRNTAELSNEENTLLAVLKSVDARARKAIVSGVVSGVQVYNSEA